MKTKEISVFFPTFNEEGNISNTVQKAVEVLKNLGLKYEILIINDGSRDNTLKVSEDLASKNPNIRVINHPQNLGYGEALKSGFYNAKYDIIVYADGDGQFDFSEITRLLEKIDENDVVIGYRIKRQDPFLRKVFGKGWRLSIWTFFQLTLKDVDCGFKMVKRKVLQTIPHLESQRGAMINAELAIKAKKFGFKVTEVGVNHYPRLSGKPTGASVRVIIKSYLDLVRLWWKLKDQKYLFIILMAILALAAILRLYKISGYMTFLGDEGRDALIIKDMVVNNHFPLIGPPTSVGNIYLGPLYYYMMGFFMIPFGLNPVAAAVMNALIGVLTVGLIYLLGRSWFNRWAGLFSAFLYAISPININYSKTSWNPNPAPFFTLIAVYAFYKAQKNNNFKWLFITGASVAAALQMHYLALILLPVFGVFWLNEIICKDKIKNKILGTIGGVLSFLFVMSPLVWFDLRHNFLNYRAITELFNQGSAVKFNIFTNFAKIPDIYVNKLIGRYMAGENSLLTLIVSILVILPVIYVVFLKIKGKKVSWPIFALGTWLVVGIFGLSFYSGNVYDHYLGFLNPVPFLLLGSWVAVTRYKKWVLLGLAVLSVGLTIVNIQKSPLSSPPNNQLQRTKDVAKFIINETGNKDFNFALLSKNNYDAAYQFYLGEFGHAPKVVPFDKTSQLFVVCEDESCDPTHSPKYEIAGYGYSKIEWMKEFAGVKIYKLVPNPTGKP